MPREVGGVAALRRAATSWRDGCVANTAHRHLNDDGTTSRGAAPRRAAPPGANRPHRRRTPEDGRAPGEDDRRAEPTGEGSVSDPPSIATPTRSARSSCPLVSVARIRSGWWKAGLGLSPMPDRRVRAFGKVEDARVSARERLPGQASRRPGSRARWTYRTALHELLPTDPDLNLDHSRTSRPRDRSWSAQRSSQSALR